MSFWQTALKGMGGPWGMALAGAGAIGGYFSMRARRKAERRRKRKEKAVAEGTQKQMLGSLADIKEEYAQRALFAREGYQAMQERTMTGYGVQDQQAQAAIGQSDLAYGGGAERQRDLVREGYEQQYASNKDAYGSQYWNLERALESDLRGVKTGLLNLEATAAQRGYRIPGVGAGVDTSSTLGGYK